MSAPLVPSAAESQPWFKQFWPWFIFGLPAIVVVAGILTVFIAVHHADSLVADDYYKQGLGINRVLAEDELANTLQLSAALNVDLLVGEIAVSVAGQTGKLPAELTLKWIHPTSIEQDFSVTLRRNGGVYYRGQLPGALSGRWYLQLHGDKPEPWRLRSEINLDDSRKSVF